MENWYKVKRGTKVWEELNDCFAWKENWSKFQPQIEEFLGFPMIGNLYYTEKELMLKNEMVPDEWKPQFKKNHYPAIAKHNSKIHKEWTEMCKRLNLYTKDFGLVAFIYNLSVKRLELMFDELYVMSKEREELDEERFEKCDQADFHRLKAKWLDESKQTA